jgi:holo-[acyl-carrier protein] synthase
MIVGVGIDVCSTERMKSSLERWGDRLWNRVLAAEERSALGARRDRHVALAGRFAAKEACIKALGGAPGASWQELVVKGQPFRPPELELRGVALEHARALGVRRMHVSITHDAGVAAAIVILEAREEAREP